MATGRSIRILLAAGWTLLATTARAGQASPSPPAPQATPTTRSTPVPETPKSAADGRRTLGRLPANLWRGAVGVFHADNLVPLLAGGTATASVSFFDDHVADLIADPDSDFGKSLENGVASEVVAVATAGAFVAGRLVHGTRFRAMSYDLFDAYLLNEVYTNVLKVAVGRARPNGEDAKSFPSGHSSNAFVMATVLERHYGWKAGVPAYALASAVAISRLQRNKHYLSDVVAGATLGFVVGRTVVRLNGRPLDAPKRARVSLSPVVGRRTLALSFAVDY
jgi:membrane-associated phospholipid phosphatase